MRPALPLALTAAIAGVDTGTAWAENERALSASVGWATFSVPGEAVNNMAPPTITPDVGGALSATY